MTIPELNELLRRSLGSNPYGEGLFKWEYSEDLYWPTVQAGKYDVTEHKGPVRDAKGRFQKRTSISVVTPVCKKERMCTKYFRQWVITRWLPPERLHTWTAVMPGTPFPARGYRVHINGTQIPPDDVPNLRDTERFIENIREARSISIEALTELMEEEWERREKESENRLTDQIEDAFTAFLNVPGSRGYHVSFPSVEKKEKKIEVRD